LHHPQVVQIPFEIAYIAANLAKNGWDITICDGWLDPLFSEKGEAILPESPCNLAVIHVESLYYEKALQFGRAIKQWFKESLLLAIGHVATTMPEILLEPNGPFDACVDGEPEMTILEAGAAVLSNGNLSDIPGLILPASTPDGILRTTGRRDLIENLDSLPYPAYQYFQFERYAKMSCHAPIFGKVRWGWLLTSRGCSFGCSFCSPLLRKSHGTQYRAHSIGYVVNLVDMLQEKFRCNAIAIEDDVFIYSKKRTIEICEALASRPKPIPWTAQARIDTLDADLIFTMKRAGCVGLCIGIESGDMEIRKRYKNCNLSNEEIEEIIRLVHNSGIHTTLYFMLGFPGETPAQMKSTMVLARKLKPLMIQVAFYTPYPGSKAWEEFIADHPADKALRLSHYNEAGDSCGAVHSAELWEFRQRFYRNFYLNPRYIWRYMTGRFPYTVTQGREIKLACGMLQWLAGRWRIKQNNLQERRGESR
ncbi:MAG: radical SAM protein, partial [Deltaproteobacteria bacterium]|nr:radical SAM protein [Deltaproteobacteria bacterium]